MAIKAYYNASISKFLGDDAELILGILTGEHHHALEETQRWAWLQQISILKIALSEIPEGQIFLEFYIPRMGKRVDALLIAEGLIFVIEFKVGATGFAKSAIEQVHDYALDLKNFHEGSHSFHIVPILVSTKAECVSPFEAKFAEDLVAAPISTNERELGTTLANICRSKSLDRFDIVAWMATGYRPTPTIIEAAEVLYRTHSVADISRYEANKDTLQIIGDRVGEIVDCAHKHRRKAICFITGVPGSGKTLAGLNIATRRSNEERVDHAVFLSGNGPLVYVLRAALARDKTKRDHILRRDAERQVHKFIQNIHHFRDEYVGNDEIPVDRVVVFDEAQRAWTREQASSFMQRKRGQAHFDMSEPEFLISVMDRHPDWCTIVCLVGEGQEIHTGEAGISEWLIALENRFPDWEVHVSPRIELARDDSGSKLKKLMSSSRFNLDESLHLSVSIRSFRAEALSEFVGQVVDSTSELARSIYKKIEHTYPIYLTRDLAAARDWLRRKARGSQRFGLVASSGALRLKAEGINMKAEIDPANWFLNPSDDVRSSCYLEDVASEFDIQGLELDWVGVCWDGDFHHDGQNWVCHAFKGTKWQSVRSESNRLYLKNAYRVLLTRARQGMILYVPRGDQSDHTRPSKFYDGTFDFLLSCGIPVLE